MLIELCANNHGTFYGLVNGVNNIFKISMTYNNKTILWIMFQKKLIKILTRENG